MLRLLTILTIAGLPNFALGYDIVLRREAVVVATIVRLGDLAEIGGPSQRYVQELEQLELFPAPSLNRSRYVTINDIRTQLNARGFANADLYLTGASRTRIARTDDASSSSDVDLVSVSRQNESSDWNGGPLASDETLAVHTVRPIRRGEVIQAEDLTIQPINTVRTEGDYETRLDSLIGKEATRSLPALRPVESSSVREPIVVQKNDVVTIIAQIGGLVIRRDAIATGDASVGQLLTVQAISPDARRGQDRGELFQVRVTGPGQAMTLNSAPQKLTRNSNAAAPQGVR
ncbi:MAG: flagellar basal body P-ring formation chaperone FlgA [Blastopirellula sp. JB062]